MLVYLVKACQLLKATKTVVEIQGLMDAAIFTVFEMYPPGEGLKEEQLYLTEALKKLEYKPQNAFVHKPSKLKNDGNKQSQL